uniref:Uncharacterized protein n=1 Tax=Oryza punctata TaxID=4537 RepID=A0A0E0LJ24_ORYPU
MEEDDGSVAVDDDGWLLLHNIELISIPRLSNDVASFMHVNLLLLKGAFMALNLLLLNEHM